MIGTNTTELAATSYNAGYHTGIDHVMTDLAELIHDSKLTKEEQATAKKIYDILVKSYPAE